MLRRSTLRRAVGGDLVVRVNPSNINYYVGKNDRMFKFRPVFFKKNNFFEHYANALLKAYGAFVIDSCRYNTPKPIEDLDKFKKIRDFIQNRNDYRKSIWYLSLCQDLNVSGVCKYKNQHLYSTDEIDRFFEGYLLKVIKSLECDGYREDKSNQIGYVMIGPNGELHKSNAGEHRCYIGKLLGIPMMPFRIKGIHEKWMECHSIPAKRSGIPRLLSAIRELERSFN